MALSDGTDIMKMVAAGDGGASAVTEARLTADESNSPWERQNVARSVLILALMGFCFAFFPTVSILLNEWVKQGRFELASIGTAYTLLVLSQAGGCLLYGLSSKMQAFRKDLFWSFIANAAIFFVMEFASGLGMLMLFALLGLPLGVMLSIATAGLVSFGKHVVRMLGFVSIMMRALQLAITAILSTLIVPYFAAAGGFTFLALVYLAGAFLWPLFFVDSFAAVKAEKARAKFGVGTLGALGLVAALLIFGDRGALVPYVVPLGEFAGLSSSAARQAMSVFIGGQLTGAIIVVSFAFGRRYIVMLTSATVVILAAAGVCAFSKSSPTFYLGIFTMAVALAVKDVFILPMLMHVDPTNRAALQVSTASLIGEALGPLATGALLTFIGVRSALITCCSMIVAGMVFISGLQFSAAKLRK